MLSSISPVGEAARRQRWSITVGAYLVGSALGGLALGALAGGLGQLALGGLGDPAALVALAALTITGLVIDAAGGPPSWRRQVDERWLDRYRGWVYGLGFGGQLGAGVLTIVGSSVVYVTVAAAALTRSATSGAVVGLTFGAVRGLPVLLGGTTRTVAALRARLARQEALRSPAARATTAGQAAIAVVAVVAAATELG